MNRSAIPTPILAGEQPPIEAPLAASLFGLDLGSLPWLPVALALLLMFFVGLVFVILLARRSKRQPK
jgi:hypothetical protein